MSLKRLRRRLDRASQTGRLLQRSTALRAYVAFVAAQHGLPVDALLAETEAMLVRARQATRENRSADLLEWLAADSGCTPEAIRAEADASLVAWREQER